MYECDFFKKHQDCNSCLMTSFKMFLAVQEIKLREVFPSENYKNNMFHK